jgi:hypothetical protein
MPSVGIPHRPTHHTQSSTANAPDQISLETITDPFGGGSVVVEVHGGTIQTIHR